MDRSPEARDLMIQQRMLFKNLNHRLEKQTRDYDHTTRRLRSPQQPTLNGQAASPFCPPQQHALSSPLYSITESVEEVDSGQRASPAWSEKSTGKMAKSQCGPIFSEHILFDPVSEEEMTNRTAADRDKHYLQSLDELSSKGSESVLVDVKSRAKRKGFGLRHEQRKAETSKPPEVSPQRAGDVPNTGREGVHVKGQDHVQALVMLEKEQTRRRDRLLNTFFAENKSGNKQLFQASGSQEWSDSLADGRRSHSTNAASVMGNTRDCDSGGTNCSHSNLISKRETKGAPHGKSGISSEKLAGGDNLETDASQKAHGGSKCGFPNGTASQFTADYTDTFNSEGLDSIPSRKWDGFDLLRMLQAFFSRNSEKTLHDIFFQGDSGRDQASKESENGGDISPEADSIALQKAQGFRYQRNGNLMRTGCGDMRRPSSIHDNTEIDQQYEGHFTDTEVSDSDSDSDTSVVSAIHLAAPQVPKLRLELSSPQQMLERPLHSEADVPTEKKTPTNMLKDAEFLVQAICDNIQYLVPAYLNSKFPGEEYGARDKQKGSNSTQNEETNARKHKVSPDRKRKTFVRKRRSYELTWDGAVDTKHKPLNKKLFQRLRPQCLVEEDIYTKTLMEHKYSNLCKVYQQHMPNIYQKEYRKLINSMLRKSKSQSGSNLAQKQSFLKRNSSTPSVYRDWKHDLMKLTQEVYDNPQSPDLFDHPDLSTSQPLTNPSFFRRNCIHEFPWLAHSASSEDSDSNSDEPTMSEAASAHTSPCLACRAGLEGSSHRAGAIDFLDNLTKNSSPEQFALQPTRSSFSQPTSHKKKFSSASNIATQQPRPSTESPRGVCSDTGRGTFSKHPPSDQTSRIMKESRDLLLSAISASVKDLLKKRFPSPRSFTPSDVQAAANYVTGNTAVMASLLTLVTDSLAERQAKITQQQQQQQTKVRNIYTEQDITI